MAGTSVLLAGDLETAAQDQVLATGRVGRVDVVKVPHHGSAKQSPDWARMSSPAIALIGVGMGNDYGHPAAATVRAYESTGAVVGRTDLDGDLAVVPVEPNGSAPAGPASPVVLGLVRRGAGRRPLGSPGPGMLDP